MKRNWEIYNHFTREIIMDNLDVCEAEAQLEEFQLEGAKYLHMRRTGIKQADLTQYLFKVDNTPDGLAFIKAARDNLAPHCKLTIRPNGPRTKARIMDGKTSWCDYRHYLPLRHATSIRVYLNVQVPSDTPQAYTDPGTWQVVGPKSSQERNFYRDRKDN